MSLIGSVFERKATGKGPPKPPSPSASKTGFPPVQHRSKSAFLRGRDESRKRSENGRASGNTVPQVLAVTEAETPKSNDDGWREQISRENEARVGGMSEEERQAEIQEIIERFGSGIGDILKKARAAREKQSSSGARPTTIAMNLSDGFDKMEEVPVTSPTIEERRAIRRVGSPPPALSTASTRPSSRAENRKLRFAELIPTDVHVYESAPPSPRKRAPLLLTAPPDEPTEGDKPISLGTWKGALQMQTNPVASEPEAPPEPDIAATNHENADPEVGSPEYIRRKYFPQIPANDPSLAWIEENSTASSSGPALRFDLNGVPITSAQSSTLPTHLGLHHHAEGSRAGYTLDDIFLLTRSTVPAQRTVMFGVLAGIVRWILKAKQDPSAYSGLDGAEEIKGKEEELRRRILAAGVSAMGDRGSPGTRAIEVVWECLVGWDRTSSEHFASVEMEQKYKSANKPKSAISTLSLDFTLPQIADSFGLGALPSESLVQLLELVHRLAKENSATADAIVGTSKLVSNMVQKFLLALPSTSTVGISFGPNPLALEVLIILASASRTNATALVEYADALLRFIITLPSSSQFTRPLSTTLLSLTLKFYTTLASYGLYANIATTATAQLNALHRWILEEHAVSLSVDYLQLLHAWIICATDPHRTTPHHDLLWSQVVGWRWDADILEYRSVAEIHNSAELWAAIWDAEAGWLEGSRVNAVRAGITEKEAVVSAFKHGFERGKESECVASCIRRLKQGLESCDEPQRLATLSTSASTLAAALRLWIACAPPATDTLVAPHLLLPFDSLSELSAHIVNHRFWSWLQDDAQTLRHPFMLAWCRPMTQLLYAFLRVSRCIPDVPDDLWFAQAFTVLSRLVPGDEDIGVAIIKEVLALAGRDFLSSKGLDVPEVIWDKGGFAILQPFLAYTLRPDKEKYIGPFHPTPQSILASTTQRLPSSSAISNRTESRGLSLDRTWCMSPVAELLQSGASPVFQDLPSSWDSSETEVVRASLLLARMQRGVLASYRLLGYAMSAEETVFTCMRVFMLEHGQPHHDSSEEVFRDPIVGRFLHDLLLPHTISSRVSSQNPREEPDLEQVASRFLGPSTPFYQYYTDFVALYDAISFLHPIFTRLLLPPISMRYPLDYRKFLWNDYAHVLKNIRTPIAEVVAPSLKEYLYPVERNAQLLGAYLRPLVKGELEQSEFLKKIAVHHISCNIWEDLGDGYIVNAGYDSARAAQLLRAVVQGSNTIIKDIVLYDAKGDVTTCDLATDKRKKRLASLDTFEEKSLSDRLRGLLDAHA